MRPPISISSLLLIWSVAAQARSLFYTSGSNQQKLNDITPTGSLDVPGDSPLRYCQDPSNDLLSIDHVNLTPDPPVPGKNLTIEAIGTLKQDVEEGSKAWLEVKYGFIKIINQEIDLCEHIQNVNKTCPLEKGQLKVEQVVEIPAQVPKGKYWVKANVYTENNDTITCLEADVTFS